MICDEEQGPRMEKWSGMIRTTEWEEVTFRPLPAETTIPPQLAALDKAEAELRGRFQEKLNELTNRRASLLALTHDSAA